MGGGGLRENTNDQFAIQFELAFPRPLVAIMIADLNSFTNWALRIRRFDSQSRAPIGDSESIESRQTGHFRNIQDTALIENPIHMRNISGEFTFLVSWSSSFDIIRWRHGSERLHVSAQPIPPPEREWDRYARPPSSIGDLIRRQYDIESTGPPPPPRPIGMASLPSPVVNSTTVANVGIQTNFGHWGLSLQNRFPVTFFRPTSVFCRDR